MAAAPFYGMRRWMRATAPGPTIVILLVLAAGGVVVRRHLYAVQQELNGSPLLFTAESAVEYYLAKRVLQGDLPQHDRNIGFPEGVDVSRTFSMGAEYVYRALAPLLPRTMDLAEKLRWLEVVWFSCGILLVGLLVRAAARGAGIWEPAAAAAFYAVSPAAVVRSSGVELSRENLAFPLLVLHLLLLVRWWRRRSQRTLPGEVWRVGGAAAVAGAALVLWDMTQYYLGLLAAAGWLGLWRGYLRRREFGLLMLVHWAVLTAVCLIDPYLRAHGVAGGVPLSAAGAGAVASAWWMGRRVGRGRAASLTWVVAIGSVLGIVWLLQVPAYAESYGHFGKLLVAKLRFLNRKPTDPALLGYEQRIMWTPALNSATWRLTFALFPGMLAVAVVLGLLLWRQPPDERRSRVPWLFFFGVALITYGLFVRFHAYAALFGAAWIGVGLSDLPVRRGVRRALALLVTAALAAELGQSWGRAEHWGRPGVYYGELRELVGWLGKKKPKEPVLANFSLSGPILAYAGCPVVLYPKFESPDIRNRVREYGETMFRGDLKQARRLVDRYCTKWLVWSKGEFSGIHPEWQMRYVVDALNPPPHAPARLFEFSSRGSRYFPLVWENRKYRVFRAIGYAAEAAARERAEQAWSALQRGRLADAESLAWEALREDPYCRRALEVIRHVGSLEEEGFSYVPPEPDK